jgi:hypothetical protein
MATLKGLILSIIFFCTFPVVYVFLISAFMYGDEEFIKSLASFALILLLTFILVTVVSFIVFIRQLKKYKSYNPIGLLVFFTLLLLISYPLMLFSPFINLHTLKLTMTYDEAIRVNMLGGSIFFIIGISLDILRYRITKKTV